ncbi:hypothetical protein K438DRAFT_2139650 [Mycena galopus ATCC 62051]|nr:hypothetical protein K438DRAFT_2139650 [Mycena galopus ATCC 62051]
MAGISPIPRTCYAASVEGMSDKRAQVTITNFELGKASPDNKEIGFIWTRPKTPSAYWFFTLRYGALLANIAVVVFSFVTLPSHKSCFDYTLMHQVLMLITELVVSAVMIIRIYALYGCSARVLWSLLGIGICLMALTVILFTAFQFHLLTARKQEANLTFRCVAQRTGGSRHGSAPIILTFGIPSCRIILRFFDHVARRLFFPLASRYHLHHSLCPAGSDTQHSSAVTSPYAYQLPLPRMSNAHAMPRLSEVLWFPSFTRVA